MQNPSRLYFQLALIIIFCASLNQSHAQTKAVTIYGDTVVLLDDGRWEFIENYINSVENNTVDTINVNETLYVIPTHAGKVTKHLQGDYEIWYDDNTWEVIEPKLINPQANHAFKLSRTDAFAMLIHEKINLPVESLKSAAIANARKAAPDAKVIFSEYRTVNDHQILHIVLSGTLQGGSFVYHYYFASNEKGTTQFIVFTTANLYEDLKTDFDDLLNGLMFK